MADTTPDAQVSTELCFTLARSQGVPINLVFLLDMCEFSRLAAPCIMVKNGHFVIRGELEQLAAHPLIWGADVSGYFVIMHDGKSMPCHFMTRLTRIYNGPLNSVYLVFPVPETLDHNQRRFSKRVNLSKENREGFSIWYGRLERGGPDALPALGWTLLENSTCELGELSASGMRLDAQEGSLLTQAAINEPLLLKGDFGKGSDPNPLFVRSLIVRVMPKPDTGGIMSYGCRFLSWRKVNTPFPNTWFRADADGVGVIAEWLNRNFRSVAS